MQWDGSIPGDILVAIQHANGLGVLAIALRLRGRSLAVRDTMAAHASPGERTVSCGEACPASGYRPRSVSLSPMLAYHVGSWASLFGASQPRSLAGHWNLCRGLEKRVLTPPQVEVGSSSGPQMACVPERAPCQMAASLMHLVMIGKVVASKREKRRVPVALRDAICKSCR